MHIFRLLGVLVLLVFQNLLGVSKSSCTVMCASMSHATPLLNPPSRFSQSALKTFLFASILVSGESVTLLARAYPSRHGRMMANVTRGLGRQKNVHNSFRYDDICEADISATRISSFRLAPWACSRKQGGKLRRMKPVKAMTGLRKFSD